MPKACVTLTVLVTVDVPDEHAPHVNREDLLEMARHAIPETVLRPGPADGVQVIVDGVAMEDADAEPVFADVYTEHDITADPAIEFDDDGFTKAEAEAEA